MRAKAFLKRKGYAIVARNWKWQNKEIDIVAREGKTLVFVEVKTRKAASLQSGFYAVGEQKKRHLEAACKAYLRCLKHPPKTFRFDIIEVQHTDSQQYSVHHYENVLLFPKYFHCE
jgi:putative endonuclease